ncbi:subtilisin-like protein [Xylariaceae sp. FL0255]|nr:subtilisin-like protein [Xylariaceae sp. FL0255]
MKYVTGAILLGALASSVSAKPWANHHVVHEKRHVSTEGIWSKGRELDSRTIIPFRIGLKQSNLEHGDRWLMEISDPDSPSYGRHWSADQVIHAFKPSDDTVKSVHDWLVGSGIGSHRHRLSEGLNWLEFDATAAEAESLFKTKYHLFSHPKSGAKQVPDNLSPAEGNSVGIVEYTPESFLQSDLNTFFSRYVPQAVGEAPVFDSIDGGYLFQGFNSTTAFNYLGEPSLDLQYSMALLYPQNVILYQVGDLAEDNITSFNNFLDAIDGSYCTYDGGDDPDYDAVYPDPYPGPHSYKGKEDCGTYAPAKVISTSCYDEVDLPPSYEERQCYEYMKLGLMGTTFSYSSGDYGVGGYGGSCLNDNGTYNDGTSGNFVPSFPSGCPYVLSVGATQIRNGTNNVAQLVHEGKQPEVTMELYLTPDGFVGTDFPIGGDPIGSSIFSSSGGFSNVFPLPSYQAAAVTAYNEKYAPNYGGKYNATGRARGFPDISSNGAWLSIVVDGEFSMVFGTSCAAPTIAALLGLINGERLKVGKKSVGFINPTLYKNPQILNDVTLGGNPGCGTYGFNAEPGWDPATGLGTPNFPKMLELFLSLP